MAGSKYPYMQAAALNQVFGASAFSPPATLYIALYTVSPSGGSPVEVSGGSYARVPVTNNSTNWPAASGSNPASKSNGTAITFATATAPWGTVVSSGVCDALSGGNLLYYADLTVSKTIGTGDTASFGVGALVYTEQ